MKKTLFGLIAFVFMSCVGWSFGGWIQDQTVYNLRTDGTIYNKGISVTSGNYVCYNNTTGAFYVKSSCP